jgi:solute carrier family 25 (mitochondrial iron transporter), member 28/37
MFIGCIPAHAAYFSIYEETKKRFRVGTATAHPLGAAFAGMSATLAHDLVMTPCDTVKQRLQLGFYRGPMHCVKMMIHTEGIRGLYVSLPTTLSMNLPFGAVMVATNEKLKDLLLGSFLSDKDGKHTIASFLVAGSGAGAVAAVATTPLDMVKTRLQTQQLPAAMAAGGSGSGGLAGNFTSNMAGVGGGISSNLGSAVGCARKEAMKSVQQAKRQVMTISHPCGNDMFSSFSSSSNSSSDGAGGGGRRLTGAFDAARVIYMEQGLPGFMRGCIPRLLVSAPSVAVSWTAYECAKSLLKDKL